MMASKTEKCPICDTLSAEDYAPFCSKRCANVDLHKWLNGSYAFPAAEDDSEGADITDEASQTLH